MGLWRKVKEFPVHQTTHLVCIVLRKTSLLLCQATITQWGREILSLTDVVPKRKTDAGSVNDAFLLLDVDTHIKQTHDFKQHHAYELYKRLKSMT